MSQFVPGPETSRAFRDALGAFATGVTLVTTRTEFGPVGMVANSFASVSLDPALVLWSPAKTSRRHDAFAGAESYAIHVLDHTQLPVAEAFAKSGDAFDLFDTRNRTTGIPIIEGALTLFQCRRFAAHDAGDHTIIIGEVIAAETRSGDPLVFAKGQYGRFTGAH